MSAALSLPLGLLAEVWVHNLDPYVYQLWEGGPIRWYGMVYLFGFTVAFLLMREATRRGVSSLQSWEVADVVTTLSILVVVGARVGYVIFYKPSLLWGFSSSLPFWDLLAFHKGGMSAHGGVLGLLGGTIYLAQRYNHRWGHLADLVAFCGAIGLFFGRLTNYINGELYGRVVKEGEALAWTATKFPGEMREWSAEQVRAIQPALIEQGMPTQGVSPVEWAIAQIQAKNVEVANVIAPHLNARYPSQLFQALLEGLIVWLLIVFLWRRPRKPGLACAVWLAGYGAMRFIAEFWRQPDTHIADQEFAMIGLSRGQLLCVAMIAFGVLVAAFAAKAKAPNMGGWRSTPEDHAAWLATDGASENYCGSGLEDPDAQPKEGVEHAAKPLADASPPEAASEAPPAEATEDAPDSGAEEPKAKEAAGEGSPGEGSPGEGSPGEGAAGGA